MIFACFHLWVMMLLLTAVLNMVFRYSRTLGSRFLFVLIGIDGIFIIFVDILNFVLLSLVIARSIIQLLRFVECLVIFINWLNTIGIGYIKKYQISVSKIIETEYRYHRLESKVSILEKIQIG